MTRLLLFLGLLFAAASAPAQTFPALSGRVVDQANIIPPDREAALVERLAGLEAAGTRQLVIVTLNSLEGLEIEEYGYRLGREWGIGQEGANNGAILLVAPNERRVRVEVGYGLEGILTDALSSQIINNQILPRFKAGDFPGGIEAGAEALIVQLQAPPELAERRAAEAAAARPQETGGGSPFPLIFWIVILFFVVIPMLRSGLGGGRRRYRRRGLPIVIWGPGMGGGGGWGGGGWGGGSGGFGGGGGFSGGGGSFGGGGASGGW